MRRFRAVNSSDSRAIVRFCKQNEVAISNLSGDEFFYIWTKFMDALNDVGDYGYLPPVCEEVLEYAIYENIKFYNGEDIYLKALYIKSLAHYHLHQTEQSEKIIRALLKLKPQTIRYKKLLHQCFMRTRPTVVQTIYAAAIFGYFLAVLVALVRILYVNPFAPFLNTWCDVLQWGFFILSGFTMLCGYLWHRKLSWKLVESVVL